MRLEVPYQKLVPDPHNVRSRLRNISSLAESIEKYGLLENLVVIEIPQTDGEFMVKAGARRYEAIGLLIKTRRWVPEQPIPVLVQDGDGDWEQLVENLQREDTPIWDTGRRFSEHYEAGFKQEEIGARVGKSQGYVSRAIQIAQGLAPPTIDLIIKNRIQFPDTTLLKLASLKDEHGQPDEKAQRDRVILYGARRGRRQRAAPTKNQPPKDIVFRRYRNLRDNVPVPLHAEKYVEAILNYLAGKIPRLNFDKCKPGADE